MSNRPEAGERSGLAEAETEARQRSAVSNRAVTRGDVMPSVETLSRQNPADKRNSGGSESRPPSIGRVTTAFAATALVVMGTLFATGALLLIVAVIRLGINAARSIDIHVMVKPLTLGDGKTIAAITIFAGTYLVIAIGKLPGYRLDRAGAALLGASLMAAIGVVSLDQAYRAIDFDTITLLLGMMIVVANLRLSGFFRLVNNWVVTRARHPFVLLMAIVLVAGSFSAFLVNDTICLAVTPLVLDLATRLKRDPVPYLLAIPLASNVGSTATITGNPQNMIIGGLSRIPYGTFAAALWPVAAVGLILTVLLIALIYRGEFLTRERFPAVVGSAPRYHRPLVIKSVLVTLAMVILFFAGQPVAKVAITGGALLLLTRWLKADKVYHEIDWPLLLMFAGLFIVVTGLETAVLTPELIARVGALHLEAVPVLSAVTALLSNLVSNVPAVLVLKPFITSMSDPQHAWLVVAMASTLAGNFTLVGSAANLIVAQRARSGGVTIGFWAYFKVGAPLTVLTILFGVWWL
jgi:Na+/H+ antiporter NhaD/arsenite permease-like protein